MRERHGSDITVTAVDLESDMRAARRVDDNFNDFFVTSDSRYTSMIPRLYKPL